MTFEANTGLGVFNQYGPRQVEASVVSGGELHGAGGAIREAVLYINASEFVGLNLNTSLTLPAGALVKETIVEVQTAFIVGGTTPVMNIGTDGSEVTNFTVALTEAQAETVATVRSQTTGGTMSASLAAETAIGVSVTGASATLGATGKAKVIIRYVKI